MKKYRFNLRGVIRMELSEPTVECFRETIKQTFACFFMNKEMLEEVERDFKVLLKSESYEVVEVEDEKGKI